MKTDTYSSATTAPSVMKSFLSGTYMVLAYAAILSAYMIFDQKNTWNDGLGFDGSMYAAYSRCLPDGLLTIENYHVNRLLLPVLAKLVSSLLDVEMSPAYFIIFYSVVNYVALVGTYVFCLRLFPSQDSLSLQVLLLSAFLCYPFIMGPSFYPTLSDYLAAFLTTGAYYWSKQHKLILAALFSFLVFFCHPLALPVLILVLPLYSEAIYSVDFRIIRFAKWSGYLLIYGLFVAFLATNCFVQEPMFFFLVDCRAVLIFWPVTLFYIACIYSRLFGSIAMRSKDSFVALPKFNLKLFLILLFVLIACVLFKKMFGHDNLVKGNSLLFYFYYLIYAGSERPLTFVSSNFVYFGPLYILLTVFYLFLNENKTVPIRERILFSVFMLISIRPESRGMFFLWPSVLIVFLSRYRDLFLDRRKRLFYAVVVLSVLSSSLLLPNTLVKHVSEDLVDRVYSFYQGGFQNFPSYITIMVIATLLSIGALLAIKKQLTLSYIPVRHVKMLIVYEVIVIGAICILNYSPVASPARQILLLQDYELIPDNMPIFTNIKNMGDKETKQTAAWRWSFGPSSSISFFLLSAKSVTMKAAISGLAPDQEITIGVNDSPSITQRIDNLHIVNDREAGKCHEIEISFFPKVGINTINIAANKWAGNGYEAQPGEDRKFAIKIFKLKLVDPFDIAYYHKFPFYLFLYGKQWPYLDQATTYRVKN